MFETIFQLLILFGGLSLLAFGGGIAVIPDMQRAAVDVHQWMTAQQFLDIFALSRALPGPGSLIVVLIGQKAAGIAGAAAAALGMYGPACLLVFFTARAWHRARERAWRRIAERALGPIAVGLTFASGLVLAEGSEHDLASWGITIAATLLLTLTEINPVPVLLGGAAIALVAG
jgi:chromate transporter